MKCISKWYSTMTPRFDVFVAERTNPAVAVALVGFVRKDNVSIWGARAGIFWQGMTNGKRFMYNEYNTDVVFEIALEYATEHPIDLNGKLWKVQERRP